MDLDAIRQAIRQLQRDLETMLADPDQEITGEAISIVDAAVTEALEHIPEHEIIRKVREVISPVSVASGNSPRVAELYPIVGQLSAALEQVPTDHRETWEELDVVRTSIYERNRGVFLVHTWTPSEKSGQVADVVVRLCQHRDGPLSQGKIKSVQYTLGGKFDTHTVVQTKPADDFRIEVSMYGPMLCVAKVVFTDDSPPLVLSRYINIDLPDDTAELKEQSRNDRLKP